jgi:hypothetical protein
VAFDAYLGQKKVETIKVDLSTHMGATGEVTVVEPANRLRLPSLKASPYRLYPLSQQIAVKVCATVASHHGRPSSREKDLIDIVVMALTQEVDAAAMRAALQAEAHLRKLKLPETLVIPKVWGGRIREADSRHSRSGVRHRRRAGSHSKIHRPGFGRKVAGPVGAFGAVLALIATERRPPSWARNPDGWLSRDTALVPTARQASFRRPQTPSR